MARSIAERDLAVMKAVGKANTTKELLCTDLDHFTAFIKANTPGGAMAGKEGNLLTPFQGIGYVALSYHAGVAVKSTILEIARKYIQKLPTDVGALVWRGGPGSAELGAYLVRKLQADATDGDLNIPGSVNAKVRAQLSNGGNWGSFCNQITASIDLSDPLKNVRRWKTRLEESTQGAISGQADQLKALRAKTKVEIDRKSTGATRPGGQYLFFQKSSDTKPILLLNSTPATPIDKSGADAKQAGKLGGVAPYNGTWVVKRSTLGKDVVTFSGNSALQPLLQAALRDAGLSHTAVVDTEQVVEGIRLKREKDPAALANLLKLRQAIEPRIREFAIQGAGKTYSTGQFMLYQSTPDKIPLILLSGDNKKAPNDALQKQALAIQCETTPLTGIWVSLIGSDKKLIVYVEGQSNTKVLFEKALAGAKLPARVTEKTKADVLHTITLQSRPAKAPGSAAKPVLKAIVCGNSQGVDRPELCWAGSENGIKLFLKKSQPGFAILKTRFEKSNIDKLLKAAFEKKYPPLGKWWLVLWADDDQMTEVGGFGGAYLYRGKAKPAVTADPGTLPLTSGWLKVVGKKDFVITFSLGQAGL